MPPQHTTFRGQRKSTVRSNFGTPAIQIAPTGENLNTFKDITTELRKELA
jgi:hypothetical protein